MLDQITPIILTYNEAPNIGRTLEKLRWANDIVVVDSFSNDRTLEIVSSSPQARVFQRKFDSHDKQWNYALKETSISTEWLMALDADFVLSNELIEEIRHLKPDIHTKGYRARFIFRINGRPLRHTVCPPATFLFRRDGSHYIQDGHTQKLRIDGPVGSLDSAIFHDDRKSLKRWIASQKRYAKLEAAKLLNTPSESLDWADRVRKLRLIAVPAMALYCLVIRGGLLDGRAGLTYAFQRTLAEALLSLYLFYPGPDLTTTRTDMLRNG